MQCTDEMYAAFKAVLVAPGSDNETGRDLVMNAIEAAITAAPQPPVFKLKECQEGYGHAGHWCGSEYNCWLDPRGREERVVSFERLKSQHFSKVEVVRLQAEVERLEKLLTQALSRYADQGVELAELSIRTAALEGLLREADEFMYIMTGNDTQQGLDARYGRLEWETAIETLRGRVNAALTKGAKS